MWDYLKNMLAENQFAQGGIVLVVFGTLLVYARSIPGVLWKWVSKYTSWTVVVRNDDDLFKWLLKIISKSEVKTRTWRVTHDYNHKDETIKVVKSPAQWLSHFRYKGRRFLLWRDEDASADTQSLATKETLTVKTMWWNRKVMDQMLEEAGELGNPDKEITSTYILDYGDWARFRETEMRTLESVIMPEGVVESVASDLRRFLASRERYQELSVPYHRGYLFSGPPGNGKTSIIAGLAREFELDIYLLHLHALNDSSLLKATARIPANSMVVLEDIDCVVPDRKKDTKDIKMTAVSLSGLLNTIDGLLTPSGQVVVMTTNHPDQLDDALKRPGRIDMSVTFDDPNEDQRMRMFLKFNPSSDPSFFVARQFVQDTNGKSMAAVQGMLQASCTALIPE